MFERTRVGVVLLVCAAGLVRVSALDFHPTDVTVWCHNFENVVSWKNPEPQLQPEYVVTLRRYREGTHVDLKTTENYLDISDYTQNIEDGYLVSVKTLSGSKNNSSEVAFTYSQDFPALLKKCTADFPSVNTSALRHTIKISFDHPLDIYDINVSSAVFKYTVQCNEMLCGKYECTDECIEEIPIPESLYGGCFSLHFLGDYVSTRFNGSQEVCNTVPESETDVRFITGMVCGAVVFLMLAIVAGVEIYKAVTGSNSQRAISKYFQIFPKSLGMMSSETPVIEPERPYMSQIHSISEAPLLISPDDDVITPVTVTPEEVTHMPITLVTEVEVEEEEQRGSEEEEFFDNGGYDRKKFPLEMSPGDMVEGYHHGKD